jgi:hypothetical protein
MRLTLQDLVIIIDKLQDLLTAEELEWLRKTRPGIWERYTTLVETKAMEFSSVCYLSFRIQDLVDAKLRDKPRWWPGQDRERISMDYCYAGGLPISYMHEVCKLLNIKVKGKKTHVYTPAEDEHVFQKSDYVQAIKNFHL